MKIDPSWATACINEWRLFTTLCLHAVPAPVPKISSLEYGSDNIGSYSYLEQLGSVYVTSCKNHN